MPWREPRKPQNPPPPQPQNVTISGISDSAVAVGTGNTIIHTPATPDAATDARPDDVGRPPRSGDQPSTVRLCLAADIERYSRLPSPKAEGAQQRLVDVLARARRRSGIDQTLVETQESGDGQFAVLPTGLDESEVIPALVRELEIALREVNADMNERVRLRIRVALHRGFLHRGPNGWVGVAAIAVHRILDSDVVRAALAENQQADFVLAVPDLLYRDVIAHGYGLLRPETFTATEARMPAKDFTEHIWIYLPRAT